MNHRTNYGALRLSNLAIIIVLGLLLNACAGSSSDGTDYYSVSGAVTGLPAGQRVSISDNTVDAPAVSGNGNFYFVTSITVGDPVIISVSGEPKGYTCNVAYLNSAGDIATEIVGDVVNVQVTCAVST